MKILYIAKHGSGGNDDEGAIKHALEQLGHEVECHSEDKDFSSKFLVNPGADFLLFHKWTKTVWIKRFNIPKVFWYFDLVEYPDSNLDRRSYGRRAWMQRTTPLVDLGFCTDGDWVNKDTTGKLIRLTQGADVRVTGRGDAGAIGMSSSPLLFTGISRGGGEGRVDFVSEMHSIYKEDFLHIPKGCYQTDLANTIANSQIVVAPDHPITDHYWSNRVYMALGFGASLIHPYAKTLSKHYDGIGMEAEICYYRSREELHDRISYLLENPKICSDLGKRGLARTLTEHTYTHRCKQLIKIVQERIL